MMGKTSRSLLAPLQLPERPCARTRQSKVLRVGAVVATALLALGTLAASSAAWATPVDPAPIPDSVLAQLPGRVPHAASPLAAEMAAHHGQAKALVDAALASAKALPKDQTWASSGTAMALRAKAHDLQTRAHGVDKDASVPTQLRSALHDRLTTLAQHLQDLSQAGNVQEVEQVQARAQSALTQLHPAVADVVVLPRHGWTASTPQQPLHLRYENKTLRHSDISRPTPARHLVLALNSNSATELAAVLPAPLDATVCNYQTADLADDGVNVVLSPEIKALANQLDYSPAKILQWVKQNIRFEPYYGAAKGSQATYLSGSGGPFDIDSLTIALLRASNIPARYEQGSVTVADDTAQTVNGRLALWLGVKSYQAAKSALVEGNFSGTALYPTGATAATATGVTFNHVWIKACVPYAHYRGSRVDAIGQTWVPMDPSFRQPYYAQSGQPATSVDLDWTAYMAQRGLTLPRERYEQLVEQYAQGLNPPQTIDQIPYQGIEQPFTFDILPDALPYAVNNTIDWTGAGVFDIAKLPNSYQYRVNIALRNSASASLGSPPDMYLPAIALKRLILGFEAAAGDTSTASKITSWRTDNSGTSSLPCPTSVVPQIRLEGVVQWSGTTTVDACGGAVNQMDINLYLDAVSTSQNSTNGLLANNASWSNISASNLHSLQIDAHQQSADQLNPRISQLLATERTTTNPNTNIDGIEGEFLNVVGLKYLWHVRDSAQRIGQLAGQTGQMGLSIGLVSTQAKVEYAFDLPLGVVRSGYVIDVPAGLATSVDQTSGVVVYKPFKLSVTEASALESFIWQENAQLDAVSTVRGIQYASEAAQNNQILTITSANWASSQNAMMTGSSDSTLNYTASDISALSARYFCTTCSAYTLTIPRSKIRYGSGAGAWVGHVLTAEYNGLTSTGGSAEVVEAIGGGYSGGYASPFPIDFTSYDPVLNTGMSYFSPPTVTASYTDWTSPVYAPPPTISAAVGLGVTPYASFAGDPVNLVNGNVYHNEHDLNIKGRGGLNFLFERAYNSRDGKDGPLGFGWTNNLNQYLLFADDNPDGKTLPDDTDGIVSSIVWVDSSGSHKSIASNSAATTFTTPTGFFFKVTRQADNTFLITEKSGLKYTFENKTASVPKDDATAFANRARLTRIEDRNGNALVLSYVATTNCTGTYVCKITDGLNRSLTFTYNAAGRLDTITDWSNRQWKYGYDSLGNLTSYKNPRASAGKQTGVTYTYFGSGDGANLNHAMKQYILPAGNGMSFEYYMNGRAFRHYRTLHTDEAVSYSYNDFRRETIVTDERGNVSHHLFDQYGNTTQVIAEDGGVRTYSYDCNSTACPNPYNKLSETDPTGVTINYTYDSSGNLTKTQYAGSGATAQRFDFNAFGQPRRVQDARGNWTMAIYDTHGNVTDSIAFLAGVSYSTACSGECAAPTASSTPSTSQVSSWTHRTYDAYGNVTQVKRMRDFAAQVGPTLDTGFNDTVNNIQGLNAVTLTRTGDKNGDGTLDAPDVATMTYDSLGRTKQGLDARWYPVSVTTYDEVDRPTVLTDAVGRTITSYYDFNGNLTSRSRSGTSGSTTLTDTTTYTFNDDDRLQKVTDNAGGTSTNEFDLSGHVIATTNPDGWRVSMMVDSMGRTTEATDSDGNTALRAYDIGGRQESQTSALNLTITNTYYGTNKDGRLKRSTMPTLTGRTAGRAVEYDYDLNGNVIRHSAIGDDGTTRDFYSFYDEQNRVVREVTPLMVKTGYRTQVCRKYSNLGWPTEIWEGPTTDNTSATCNYSDPNLYKQITWVYDDFGRKITETDPNSHAWSWTYDVYGNVQTQKDGKGQTTSYTWKSGGLPDTRTDQASNKTTWTYDALYRLYTVGDANVTYTYAYDKANRVQTVTDSRGSKTLTYSWSAGGLLNRMVDAESRNTDYLYDPSGRLIGEWLPNGDYVTFGYDADGHLNERSSSTGVKAMYTWFNEGSLSGISTYTNSTNAVATTSYTLNAFGQRATIDEKLGANGKHWDYDYDSLGQISDAYVTTTAPTSGSKTVVGQYTYDFWGDLATLVNPQGTYVYNTDNANQLTQVNFFLPGQTTGVVYEKLAYDANGSLTSRTIGNGTPSVYNWDELNRLKSATVQGSSVVTQSYVYDPLGRRISKTANGTTTNYLYESPDPMAGVHGLYSSWSAPDALIAQGAGADRSLSRMPLSSGAFQSTLDFHTDAQGTASVVTQESSTTTDTLLLSRMLDPWGGTYFFATNSATAEQTAVQTATNVDPDWQGRARDETGLIYMRARYYDSGSYNNAPVIGRFISRDPAGLSAGMNLYAFGGNDPVNMADPSGMTALSPAQMQAGLDGLIAQSQTNRFLEEMGLGSLSSANQSLESADHRPNPGASSTTAAVQTTLAAMSFVPGLGTVTGLVSAGIDAANGDYVAAGLSLASAIPLVGEVGAAARTGLEVDRAITTAARAETEIVQGAEGACASGICMGAGQCFVAGTPVQTPTGTKAIEDIKEGDLVAARDEHTGNTIYEPVKRLYHNHDRVIVDVTLGDDQGHAETLGTTREHPFHLHGRGWVKAQDLAIGDQVDDLAFGTLTVKGLLTEKQKHDTYNFEVKDLHTYFVGALGAWVHNACGPVGGVYALRNEEDQIVRTGRTNDLARRMGEHDSQFPGLSFDTLYKTNDYAQQRGLEQMVHDAYNPVLNKIRPISPRNKNRGTYMDAATDFLNNE